MRQEAGGREQEAGGREQEAGGGKQVQGLDYAFLRYIGVTPEGQKRIQDFYLPFFAGCRRVLDLGCGDGDFVELLAENGIPATGVDADEQCCAAAQARGLDVVCADVFAYLQSLPEASVDGIFCAHLVEHLPYEQVLELFRLCYRVLSADGRIVVATPNVRGLFAHLEMFYQHFGHVTFYHPHLLSFLLQQAGFVQPTEGENPRLAAPLWGQQPPQPIVYDPLLPASPDTSQRTKCIGASRDTPLHRLVRRAKNYLATLIVRPYLDQIVAQVNQRLDRQAALLASLDRSFECYVQAVKQG